MTAIALDAGTTTIKAVVFDDGGDVLAVVRRSSEVVRRRPGWSEQDMGRVWDLTRAVLVEALGSAPESPSFIALTGQGDGAWLADRERQPVGPAILWNDARATPIVTEWEREGVVSEAFAVCGSRITAGMPNAIASWLARHEPDRLGRVEHILTCAGWLFSQLTGEVAIDRSEAAAPFMDLGAAALSPQLLDLYGLPWLEPLLPPLRGDDDRVSTLRPDLAAELGLPGSTPVVLAPYDICATAIGADVVEPGRACCILGTTVCVEVATAEVTFTKPVGLTVPLGLTDRYARAFPTLSGLDTLDWVAALMDLGSARSLVELATTASECAAGVVFLPYLAPGGERAPFVDPQAPGVLWNLSLDASPADVARATVEGLTLTVRECLEAAPLQPQRLALCGGGAGSTFWAQLIADTVGIPVERLADAEVGARGAWRVGVASTGPGSAEVAALGRAGDVCDVIEPDMSSHARLSARFREFVDLRERLLTAGTGEAGRG